MEQQREGVRAIWRPRLPEDRETVRRQQKELRRIRQRARRESMTGEEIERRRNRGREYYIRKKSQQLVSDTEQKGVSMDQPRMDQILQSTETDMLDPCTTAEQIKQLGRHDDACYCQQTRNLEDEQLMKQTEERNAAVNQHEMGHFVLSIETNMLNPHKNRLTHVKRQARALDNQMVNGNKDVRPQRLIHIRRQARMVKCRVVDRSASNGIQFQKLENCLDKDNSISLLKEHAQILIDISMMNGHTATAMTAAVHDLDLYEDNENITSDSEEVLAFLSGLSAKKGQCREHKHQG